MPIPGMTDRSSFHESPASSFTPLQKERHPCIHNGHGGPLPAWNHRLAISSLEMFLSDNALFKAVSNTANHNFCPDVRVVSKTFREEFISVSLDRRSVTPTQLS